MGFSLLELLITMAIIIILFVMTFGSRKKARLNKESVACRRQLITQYQILSTYAMENDGRFPWLTNATTSEGPLSLLIPKYSTQTGVFICPGSGDLELPKAEPFDQRRISYAYYMGVTTNSPSTTPLVTDEQVNTRPKITAEIAFSSDGRGPGANHGSIGGNILTLDGGVHQSGVQAEIPLPVADGVFLLNPRP